MGAKLISELAACPNAIGQIKFRGTHISNDTHLMQKSGVLAPGNKNK